MSETRFAGVDVVIDGTVRTVPPLAIRRLRALMPKIQAIETDATGMPTEASFEDVIDVLHAAVSRNYPEFDREDFADSLDIVSFPKVMDAVFKGSGLIKVPLGNASRAPDSPSTGMPSTPGAPPSSDGLGSTSTSS